MRAAYLYETPFTIRTGPGKNPIQKDPTQIKAIEFSLENRFTIISGGPGTGKTSLMVNILRGFVRTGTQTEKISLCAPTGRAAQRMTEAILKNIDSIEHPSKQDLEICELIGGTLHKLLRYQTFHHDFFYNELNPLPSSVIIVDEVSMIDVILLDKLMRAVDVSRTQVIFLGDKDQLPSVEAGQILADMIPDGKKTRGFGKKLVVLKTVYRSGGKLLSLFNEVNKGGLPHIELDSIESAFKIQKGEWSFIEDRVVDELTKTVNTWVEFHYLKKTWKGLSYLALILEAQKMDTQTLLLSEKGKGLLSGIFKIIEDARVLTLVKNGPYGCLNINQMIQTIFNNQSNLIFLNDLNHFSGEPIIITRNDYSKGLFNGDVGVLIKDVNGTVNGVFKRSDAYICFHKDMLPSYASAFAMTIHKSQGSEFNDVLLVLVKDPTHKLLSREILYTGMTRTKERLIIYGIKDTLEAGVKNRIRRHSGFMW